MKVDKNEIGHKGRIWIFASVQIFTDDDKRYIRDANDLFTSQWVAHQRPVKGAWDMVEGQMLVFFAEESYNEVSGCSIDSLFAHIKNVEKGINKILTDRTLVFYETKEGLKAKPFNQVKKAISEGEITQSTIVYDNTIKYKEQLLNDWKKPAEHTWLKKYLNIVV